MRGLIEGAIVSDAELAHMAAEAKRLRDGTDKAVVLNGLPYLGVSYVGTLPDFMALLASDRDYVKELFAISSARALKNLARLWEAMGEDVDVVAVSGLDFGTQRSEWFSAEVFSEVYVPSFREQFQWISEHTTWKSFEHSCGSVARLVGLMSDAGLDALNPVQTSAAGMDPRWLKETYGGRLTYWGGGVETQSTLPFGTPDEVSREVAERLKVFGPGGGFVFCPIHNIQADTPPENIVAAYETARELGTYRELP
jgi:uroporphyrinogen-III decarboxylase